jgi:transposase
MTFGRLQFGKGDHLPRVGWTPEQDRDLVEVEIERIFSGASQREALSAAAPRFSGRSVTALEARLHRLRPIVEAGVAKAKADGRPLPEPAALRPIVLTETDRAVIALYGQGALRKEIAAQVGLPDKRVENLLSRFAAAGLIQRRKPVQDRADMWRQDEMQIVQDGIARGLTHAQIGAEVTAANNGFPVRTADAVRRVLLRFRGGTRIDDLPQARARITPADAMLRAPVRAVPPGLSAAQLARVVAEHLEFCAGIDCFGSFAAADDLALCEHIWRGGALADLAQATARAPEDLRARFRLIVAPWAGDGPVPLGVSDVVLPALRDRAGVA